MDKFLTFSRHSDPELPTLVNKFEIWLNLSQVGWDPMFRVMQFFLQLNKSIIADATIVFLQNYQKILFLSIFWYKMWYALKKIIQYPF